MVTTGRRALVGISVCLTRPIGYTDGTKSFGGQLFPASGSSRNPQSILIGWDGRLRATRQGTLFRPPILSYASRLKRVIVTPAVYPRLVEFLHFDIQSTGQKSHCVSSREAHHNALF